MASPDLNLVRSTYAEWESGDFSSAGWAHPEIECVYADGVSPGTTRGLAAMAAGFRDWLSTWDLVQYLDRASALADPGLPAEADTPPRRGMDSPVRPGTRRTWARH